MPDLDLRNCFAFFRFIRFEYFRQLVKLGPVVLFRLVGVAAVKPFQHIPVGTGGHKDAPQYMIGKALCHLLLQEFPVLHAPVISFRKSGKKIFLIINDCFPDPLYDRRASILFRIKQNTEFLLHVLILIIHVQKCSRQQGV